MKKIGYAMAGLVLYFETIFINIPNFSYSESRSIILMMYISCLTALAVIQIFRDKRPSFTDMIIAYTLPLAVYTIISHYNLLQKKIALVFIIVITMSVILNTYMVISSHKATFKKLIQAMKNTLMIFCFCVTIFIIVPISFKNIFNKGLSPKDNYSFRKYPDVLNEIVEFDSMDNQQKINLLAEFVAFEKVWLGIDYDIELRAKQLESESTRGAYNPELKIITINEQHLMSSAVDVLETLLHEMYHAYQDNAISKLDVIPEQLHSLYFYTELVAIKNELEHYNPESYEEYYNLTCERTARQYAAQRILQYKEMLSAKLG